MRQAGSGASRPFVPGMQNHSNNNSQGLMTMITRRHAFNMAHSVSRPLAAALALGIAHAGAALGGIAGLGNGQFYGVGVDPWSVAAGDLNGDGAADIVVANSGSNSVGVLLNNGDGTFGSHQIYAAGSYLFSVAIGDLDGDGAPDLVAVSAGSAQVHVWMNHGDGSFGMRQDYSAASAPFSAALGDVDGDGLLDIVVENSTGSVSVFRNTGDGVFAPRVDYPIGASSRAVAVGDLNGDGAIDIVATNSGSNTVSVILNMGDGTFAPAQNIEVGLLPLGLAIGDLDGDGAPDLAVGIGGGVQTLFGHGDGTFAPPQTYASGQTPWAIAICDVNGNGALDLITAGGANHVVVLENMGDGSFAASVGFGPVGPSRGVAVADFDGDGAPDVVATGLNTDNVLVLFNLADTSPGEFFLLSPADGVAGLSLPEAFTGWGEEGPKLRWSASAPGFHAPEYTVALATNPDLTGVFYMESGLTEPEFAIPPGALAPGTTYWWGVVATSPGGERMSTPAAASFTTVRLGDLDNDGAVGSADLAILLGSWGVK